MGNSIKYNASATEPFSLKKGNFYIGTGDVQKGPSNFWNTVTPPAGGYTIYLNKPSNGPSIYAANNNTELIFITNQIAGTNYTTADQCLTYYAGQTDKVVFNRDCDEIITDGLIFYLDAGFTPSYPRTGNTWYDLIDQNNNTTKSVGNFNSSGYFTSVESPGYASLLEFTTTISSTLNSVMSVTSGGWSIEEWILINDTTYPEAGAGTVVSNNAYGTGEIGFDWNHGQTNMSQFQMGASWNAGQPSGYDVRGFITLNSQFRNYGSWYLRNMFWNRDTSKMGVYYNGIFQGDIDMSVLNGYPICDGGTISWGQLYGWRHDGARAGMKIYNRVLTQAEVIRNYDAQKTRFGLM